MHALAIALTFAATFSSVSSPPGRAGELVVIANQGDGTVHIIDSASERVLARLGGFDGPHEVAISPDGRWAVVSDYGTREVVGRHLRVIDLATLRVERSIELGEYRRPHDIAFLPGGTRLAVTAETHQAVLIVDFATGRVERALETRAAGSHMLTLTADGTRLYTANMGAASITAIDVVAGSTLATVPVPPRGEGIAVTPDGSQLWVSSLAESTVTVYDTESWKVLATLPATGHPYRVTISADGTRAFVPAPMEGLIRVFDVATRREQLITVPGGPGKVNLAPDGRTAFVPLLESGQVAMLDLESLRVVKTLPAGPGPDGLGVSTFRPPASATAPQAQNSAAPTATARPDDVDTIEHIVAALYDVISGPAGVARDWDRLRTLFFPGARMIPVITHERGVAIPLVSVEEYITRSGPMIVQIGFRERELARRVERFGNVAQVWSTFEGLSDTEPPMRGINSIQLVNDGKRWWVVNIAWDQERPGLTIPEQYRRSPSGGSGG